MRLPAAQNEKQKCAPSGETISALLSGKKKKKGHCAITTVAPGHLLWMPHVSFFVSCTI